jgi:hypothetical protein
MPGFNTIPAVGGGGGQANMTHVASIHMETFNRTWAQGGTAGNYIMSSANQENGYAYFVGPGMTTGAPLNRLVNINHAFTSINVVGIQNDMLSLYKVKVKATTLFSNPTAALTKNPAILIASGSFVLPSNAVLNFADIIVQGGGGAAGAGHGGAHGGGSGGGGGNTIKLTDYPIFGSTIVSVGAGGLAGGAVNPGFPGGTSSFGPVYALGGGGGAGWNGPAIPMVGAGNGGGGGHGGSTGAAGTTQSASSGVGTVGTPVFHGGHGGGSRANGTNAQDNIGGGGGGSTAAGADGNRGTTHGRGGAGHVSDLTGVNTNYGFGGSGYNPNGNMVSNYDSSATCYGCGGQGSPNPNDGSSVIANPGRGGVVVVRFYTP